MNISLPKQQGYCSIIVCCVCNIMIIFVIFLLCFLVETTTRTHALLSSFPGTRPDPGKYWTH